MHNLSVVTPAISVVIPTMNREPVLKKTLDSFRNQTLLDFEIIIVNDGGKEIDLPLTSYPFLIKLVNQRNKGPATARNVGAEQSSSDIIMFIGDDCIADSNLLFRHYYNHVRDDIRKAVQGYTVWHPDLASEFQLWLHESGAQATWRNLRTENGSWKNDASGFCLTTNYSIDKTLFLNYNGFNQEFKSAAWEDVELGYRLGRDGIPVFFDPGAINYHYHPYRLKDFMERNKNEGYWRLTLCKLHPEFTQGLINSNTLREAGKYNLREIENWATELDSASGIQEERHARWAQAIQIASAHGIIDRVNSPLESKMSQVLLHLHTPEQVYLVVSALSALDRGDISYAAHCYNWLLDKSEDNWAAWAFAAEIMNIEGNDDIARIAFDKSLSIAPSEWAKEGIGGASL